MSQNGHYNPDIITTTDEEGKIHLFEKVDELEIEGSRYALLIYQGSGDEEEEGDEAEATAEDKNPLEGYDEEIVVMRVSVEDDCDVYEAIDNEEEFERVVQYIEQMEEDDDEEETDPA